MAETPIASDSATPHRDRSRRLVLFGCVAVLVGMALIGLGLAHLALVAFGARLAAAGVAGVDARSAWMGLTTYVTLGLGFVLLGRGSIQCRRWVPSLMVSLAWIWVLSGVLLVPFIPRLVGDVLRASPDAAQIPPQLIGIMVWTAAAFAALLGLLLPAAFVWAYTGRDVQRTCQAHDPRPAWTERCPTPVLGLAVGLCGAAVLTVPLALRPAVPVFGRVIGGWPGALLMLAGAAGTVWLARAAYRLEPIGWWGTLIALVLLGVSVVVTFRQVEPIELYRTMGYSPAQLALLASSPAFARGPAIGATALLTVLSVGYLLTIRRHFRDGRSSSR